MLCRWMGIRSPYLSLAQSLWKNFQGSNLLEFANVRRMSITDRIVFLRSPPKEKINPEKVRESVFEQKRNRKWTMKHQLNAAPLSARKPPINLMEAIDLGSIDPASINSLVPVERQRTLNLAMIGPPNSGKTSIANHLCQDKVGPVSPKAQTTRSLDVCVVTMGETQLVSLPLYSLLIHLSNLSHVYVCACVCVSACLHPSVYPFFNNNSCLVIPLVL